jgi:RNA polymerase sigma factor (sigma-70 family)
MLAIVDHRVLNVTAHLSTLSHGGGHTELSLAGLGAGDSSTSTPYAAWEAGSTTPSRVASYREQAQLMLRLLAELPDDLREVFRLRHFEGLELADIGQRLGLGVSAVRHRFRKASHLYLSRLQAASGSSCMPRKPDCATLEAGDPST